MDEREQRLVEYSIEALLVAWLSYLFFYQNYLLHNWHRGLPLPSKVPFLILGVIVGGLFFWYEWSRFEKEFQKRSTNVRSVLPVAIREEGSQDREAPGENPEEDFTAQYSEQ